MDKREVQKRVLKNGKPLSLELFEWDEKTSTFSTKEEDLMLDFKGYNYCTFKTGDDCTFNTGNYCNFIAGDGCTFDAGSFCTFDTGIDCTFNTGNYCKFNTGIDCNFKTGSGCNFVTGSGCNFDTGDSCTFNANYSCTFKTGKECVVVRRDFYEIIELKEGAETTLNGYNIKGYKIKKPKKEMTVSEIEKKLGYEIKIVK